MPPLSDLGCAVSPPGSLPAQPTDLTRYGSRVVDGVSLSAVAFLGRPSGSTLDCARAGAVQPIVLRATDPGPQFAPTAITILGACALALSLLIHPAVGRRRSSRPALS